MRNNQKWLVLLLALVLLVGTLPAGASAAENESPLALYVSPAAVMGSELQVQITAAETQTVADGKLVVTYDAAALTYTGTTVGAAWTDGEAVTLSVNPAEGKVILAFASAEAASAGTVFTLTFQSVAAGETAIAIDGSSYVSGVDANLSDAAAVTVAEEAVSITLKSGLNGTFADGSAETVIQALAGSTLTADQLPPVVTNRGWALTGWQTPDGTVIALDELNIAAEEGLTLTAVCSFICAGGDSCACARFVDLDSISDEAHAAVDFMVLRGYMNGMSGTIFAPDKALTRGMMVTILHRLQGSPAPEGECRFTDVTEDRYYADAVIWADENGITHGVSENLFAPDKSLTRQELVTFLYRYAEIYGQDMSAAADLSVYADVDDVSYYALTAFEWAVAEDIIKGTTATKLDPLSTTTRVQVSLMVYRLLSSWE